MKKKFICTVCGYVYEGEEAPEFCPQCKQPRSKFKEVVEGEAMTWADEHVIGVAKGVDPEVLEGLRAHFSGECSEVGMYLAMSRQADREGYPEIAEAFKRYAWEEAEHAAKFAEDQCQGPYGGRVRRMRGQEAYRYTGQKAEPGCDSRYGT